MSQHRISAQQGSRSGRKSVVGAVVKDAYQKLKGKVAHWCAGDVEMLEKSSGSINRQNMIAEVVDDQSELDREQQDKLLRRGF